MKVVLASANPGKLQELSDLLKPLSMELIAQSDLGIESAEEPAATFVENALIKARHASLESGLPAIADDSGISATALNGAPGVVSARFAGRDATDHENNTKLVNALADSADSSAHYDCVMVFLRHPADPAPLIAAGRWNGRIVSAACGNNGFGYDPHFYLDELAKTAAQLEPEHKNRISHRGQAARALVSALVAEGST